MQYVTLCHKFTVIEEELFLQYDNRRDADRVFIFGTRASLEHLVRTSLWIGPFQLPVAPPNFVQLHTIYPVFVMEGM